MPEVFFISDTHWQHVNILKPEYCNRPFKDVNHMDEILIQNWNSRIGQEDIVYHLGDFAMGSKDRHPAIFARLNGHKHLIFGNHDSKRCKEELAWESVQEELYLDFGPVVFWLAHIPPPEVYKEHVEGRNYSRPVKKEFCTHILHGHCHSTKEERR